VRALAAVPWKRLVRAPRAWMALGFWVAVAVLPAVLERVRATGHGADHALLGFYASIALPFVAYSALSAVLGKDGLGPSGIPLANFGAPPGRVALFTATVAIAASAVLGGGLGVLVDVVGHGSLDPPLVEDALRALATGALGGAAYAAFFAVGASFGARGFGRSILLVLDWIFGTSAGTSSLLVPRAHVRSLLGGVAPLDVSARTSYLMLGGMIVVFTWFACARASRARYTPAPAPARRA
jgi:hypothetical protein